MPACGTGVRLGKPPKCTCSSGSSFPQTYPTSYKEMKHFHLCTITRPGERQQRSLQLLPREQPSPGYLPEELSSWFTVIF